ncbi:hypothetical protein P4233_12350 [Pseudomonas aeruginosa]|nr:hypothetical protein [Pseudomonas aeruginosa]
MTKQQEQRDGRRDLAEFIERRQLCGLVLACRLRDEQEDAGGVRGVAEKIQGDLAAWRLEEADSRVFPVVDKARKDDSHHWPRLCWK